MTVLTEGNLQIAVNNAVNARKFDDQTHGMSHCMKAVDFVFELADRYLFIEFKDPQHPQASGSNRDEFVCQFRAGELDQDLKYKYRDTFLYEWASGRVNKPVYYYVLIASDRLTDADLTFRTEQLERQLPMRVPTSMQWPRPIANGCGVFNIDSWNKVLSQYPVNRLDP